MTVRTPSSDATAPVEKPQSCNACGGALDEKFPRVRDSQTREIFRIVVCKKCGLGHTLPQPDNLVPYYGTAYHGGRHGFTEAYCVRRRLHFVDKAAGRARGRRLLDIGCGDGAFLLGARRNGWDVAGTEMNTTIARAAGVRVWSEIEHAKEHGPYACITSWHSLEHMRSPRDTVREAAHMLEPGGTMLVAVPNAQGLQARIFGSRWFHLDVPRHLFHFGPHSLSTILETAGLVVVRTFHLEVEFDLFGWTQSTLNWIFSEPNVFFHDLTGRPSRASALSRSANLAAGTVLTAIAAPFMAAGVLAERGAILVTVARKPPWQ